MATDGVINGTKFGVYVAGTKVAYATSASISMNHNLRDARTQFELKFSTEVTGDIKWTGQAFLTSLSADTPNEDSSTWSGSFSGTGELVQATV